MSFFTSPRHLPLPHDFDGALEQLRFRAEARQRQLPSPPTARDEPSYSAVHLVQELRMHQLEMELQYEELLATQTASEALRERFEDLFEMAPVPYLTLDVLGVIDEINLRACHALGLHRDKLKGRRFLLFVAPNSRERFMQFMMDVLSDEPHATCAVELTQPDGTVFTAHLEGASVPDQYGNRQCRIIFFDRSFR